MVATMQSVQTGFITSPWDRNGPAVMQKDVHKNSWSQEMKNGMESSPKMEVEESYFLRLRKSIPWWEKHAPKATVNLIKHGVKSTFPLPEYLDSKEQHHTPQEEAQALQVLQEYMQVGAVIKNPQE